MAKLRCGECGSLNITLRNMVGEKFPYRNYPNIELKKDCDLNVCSDCGNIIYYSEDIDSLEALLLESANMQAKEYVNELKVMLKMNQKDLAKHLGLSEVYLSQIMSLRAPLEYKVFNLIESKFKLEKLTRKTSPHVSYHSWIWKSYLESHGVNNNIGTGEKGTFPHVSLSSNVLKKYSEPQKNPSSDGSECDPIAA